MEEEPPPWAPPRSGGRRLIVRQISGAIARRIVCAVRPGEVLARGQKFGMIKLGSRTELIISDTDDLTIEVKIGQKIMAGTTVMARYIANPQAVHCEAASGESPIPNP